MRTYINKTRDRSISRRATNTRNQTLTEHPEIMEIVSQKKTQWYKDHPEYLEKLSERMSGDKNPAKRDDVKEKISKSVKLLEISGENHPNWQGGPVKSFCEYCGEEIYIQRHMIDNGKRHFCSRKCASKGISFKLEKNPRWLGGISFEPYCPKWTPELRERIRAFFNYECVICGKTTEENGEALSCHHVEYNKQACCDGKIVHFAALCRKCHNKTNSNRSNWEDILHKIIDEIYDDKSYYTKEEWSELKCY